MKEFCKKHNITESQFLGLETVGGNLYLRNLTSIPEGFNPTVGGSLYLRNLTSIPEGFNPTVGGSLYLRNLTSIPEGFNPTVGGDLDLGNGLLCLKNELPAKYIFTWQNGKYIKVDGIFSEVISKKGSVWKVKQIGSSKHQFVVTDGENFSHGDAIKQAKESLIYKISDRDTSRYKNLTLESIITKADAIKMYRAITGACEAGTRDFVEKLNISKTEVTISEIIVLTENQYGSNEFRRFFN